MCASPGCGAWSVCGSEEGDVLGLTRRWNSITFKSIQLLMGNLAFMSQRDSLPPLFSGFLKKKYLFISNNSKVMKKLIHYGTCSIFQNNLIKTSCIIDNETLVKYHILGKIKLILKAIYYLKMCNIKEANLHSIKKSPQYGLFFSVSIDLIILQM